MAEAEPTPTTSLSIGIVTDEQWPDLTDSDTLLADALEERGHAVEPVIWTHSSVEYQELDLLVIRSCYEYHTQADAFRDWLDAREREGPPVLNPPSVVRWNMHKFYLRELVQAGVDVLETEFVESGAASEPSLATILDRRGWEEAVVKPAIGTSSAGAWRTSTTGPPDDQARFEAALADGDLLVQQFAPEIADGERSLVFIDGRFSHGWMSVPARGEFRSQSTFGGETVVFEPDGSVTEQARGILETAREITGTQEGFAYARVDGIERNGRFVLMELELIEPYLGLGRDPDAPERLATALLARAAARES